MRNLILIAVFGSTLITSCNPKFYTPETRNVPLISKKGETNLAISGNANQVEFQGAYGVTNGFAIKANSGLLYLLILIMARRFGET